MVDKNITGNRKSQFSCIFISSLPAKEIKGGDKKNNKFLFHRCQTAKQVSAPHRRTAGNQASLLKIAVLSLLAN